MTTLTNWRQQGAIILNIAKKLNEYNIYGETENDFSPHSQISVQRNTALEIASSWIWNAIVTANDSNDLQKIVVEIDAEISSCLNNGEGWSADVWTDIQHILAESINH